MPQIYASSPLNGTYLMFLVDSNYNNSAPIPAEVLWIASGVTFKKDPTAVIGQTGDVYPALTGDSEKVPYVAPSKPGHTYVALLYNSPPNFKFPPNFPYNATFRANFNVTRIGADFKSPTIEATYFSVKANHSEPQPAPTGAYGSGYAAPNSSVFNPSASAFTPSATITPFTGSADSLIKMGQAWTWTRTLATFALTAAATSLI